MSDTKIFGRYSSALMFIPIVCNLFILRREKETMTEYSIRANRLDKILSQ